MRCLVSYLALSSLSLQLLSFQAQAEVNKCALFIDDLHAATIARMEPVKPLGVLNEFEMEKLYNWIKTEFKGEPISLEQLQKLFTTEGISGITHNWRQDSEGTFFQEVWIFPKLKKGRASKSVKEVRVYASGLFETAEKALRPQDELPVLQKTAEENNMAIIFAPSRGHGAAFVINEYQKAATQAKHTRETMPAAVRYTNDLLALIPYKKVQLKETRFKPEDLQKDYLNLFAYATENIDSIAAPHGIKIQHPTWSFAGLSYGGWLMSTMLSNQGYSPSMFAQIKKAHPGIEQEHFKLVLISPGIRPTGDLTMGQAMRELSQQMQAAMNRIQAGQGDRKVHEQLEKALELAHPGIFSDELRGRSTKMLITGVLEQDTAANIANLPKGSEVIMVISGSDTVVAPAQYYSTVRSVRLARPDLKFQTVVLDGVAHQSTSKSVWKDRAKQLETTQKIDRLLKEKDSGMFMIDINGQLVEMSESKFREWAVESQKNWWSASIDVLQANDNPKKPAVYYENIRMYFESGPDSLILRD